MAAVSLLVSLPVAAQAQRKRLVFHVVPHPARLGYFADVYTRAIGAPPAADMLAVVAGLIAFFRRLATPRRPAFGPFAYARAMDEPNAA